MRKFCRPVRNGLVTSRSRGRGPDNPFEANIAYDPCKQAAINPPGHSAATDYGAMPRQTAITAYFSSKQLQLFASASE